MDPLQNPTIAQALVKDHHLYQMERCNHNNNLLHILLKLHQMGVSDDDLSRIYHTVRQTMTPLLMPTVSKLRLPLNADTWSDYLGDPDMYKAYLQFFDEQIRMNGIKFVTERYFYNGNLETSVGAQRQPIIHLSLGIQYKLPGIVAQALAYLSSTYKVVDFLTSKAEYDEYSDDGLSEDDYDFQVNYRCSAYEIVMEQIKHDPRFNILLTTKHRNDKQSIFDTVLRNQQFLLRTYISSWRINDTKNALSELRTLATQIMAGSHVLNDSRILLETIMALDVLYPNNSCPAEIVRIQFLTFICSYIALGLPSAGQKESNGSIHDWLNQLLEGEEGRNIHMISTLFTLKEAFGVDQSLIYKHVLSSF